MAEIFKKVAVIGTGLMGGSLAMALRESPRVEVVTGFDSSPRARRRAEQLGIADEMAETLSEATVGAELLFIATPIGSIVETFAETKNDLSAGAIVSDLGSAKLRVTADIESLLPDGIHYVGGHPMTGSEQSGVESARPDLYDGAYYILTPTEGTDAEAFRKLHGILTDLGARVISMEPVLHDRAMATISHVPHLISLLLMEMADNQRERMENLFTVAAGGFRDMTRIAASSPEIWLDICMENKEFIVERLRDYGERLEGLISVLEKENQNELKKLFEDARRARAELSVKSGQEIEELYDVSLAVPDKPGVISDISTAIGAVGVNIEDISIVHSLEGETGIMTLKILGREQASEVVERLSSLGYRASFWKA